MVIGGGDVNNPVIDYEQVKREYVSILQWASEECDKVLERLEGENKLVGLDAHSEDFAHIHQERKKKVAALYDKYKLSPNTNLTW